MDKCKKCHDGEMVLKVEDEELQYHECNSCGFDIVSYELMVERNAIVKEARLEKVMEIPTNEKIQEFITNHLDVEDFGYLVLATDDRLNHEALCIIRGKLNAFLKREE